MDRKLRVLVLEDVVTEAELARHELRRAGFACDFRIVDSEATFRSGLEESPDLILSDFSLPGFNGMVALSIARREASDTPFIFLSGTIGEERAIEALKHGATDYVLKTNLARLGPVVARALQEHADRRAAQLANQRFRDLVQTSPDWIWEIDIDGNFVYCSPGVKSILGVPPADLIGRHIHSLVHTDDLASVSRTMDDLQSRTRHLATVTARWRHAQDGYRWLERHALTLTDARGLITGFRGADRDVTLRVQQDGRIARLNRIQTMLSNANAAILRIRERDALLQEVCRIATSGGYPNAAILTIPAGSDYARVVAAVGSHAREMREVAIRIRGLGAEEMSLTAQALASAAPVACNDLAGADADVPLRNLALRWGYRSCAALPLIVDSTPVGALVVHSVEADAFTDEELGILAQVAGSLSFALQYLEKEGAAEYLAYFDPMTGLARRALFVERLERALSGGPTGEAVVVSVIDIERLGALNDRHGRHVGDRLLQLIAERLKGASISVAGIAHLGNGCFAVAMAHERTVLEPEALGRLVTGYFADDFLVDGHRIRIAVHAGSSRFPSDGRNAEGLLQHAELAAKQAKETGETHLPFAPAMNASRRQRLSLEERLRRALEEQQFELHYQPKVSLQSGAVEGAEALLRWNDPVEGRQSPADFVPVLEASGLIVEVGRWVIRQAIRDAMAWRQASLPMVPIAVNVAARQLKRPDFVELLLADLAPFRDAGCLLDIEITETALIDGLDGGPEKLEALRAADVGIAIDDFGTGYSSLGRLANLAVDMLKIDRAFVSGIDTSDDKQAIVSTVAALARAFGLITVAEGVETASELRVLRRLHCHQAQGYLIARPMPAVAFGTWLADAGRTLPIVGHMG